MLFTPLNIQNTEKCLPQPWHPSVIYISDGWNGHKYWMAQTPFPPMTLAPYRDRYELPCVHYSDNGTDFYPIDANPLIDLTAEAIDEHYYYSDPHLVLKDGIMELYFRYTLLTDRQLIGNKTVLLRMKSSDGFHWSQAEVIADLREEKDIAIWGEQIISQAVRWDGREYQCWYVDKSSYLPERHIRLTRSKDGDNWGNNILCSLNGPTIEPWHIDVQYYDGKYQMIVYDMNKLLWYESEDGVCFTYLLDVITPSPNRYDFYTDGLYRACSVKVADYILVYFSAKRENNTYIGCLKTKDRIHFEPQNGISRIKWIKVVWKPLMNAYIKRVKKIILRKNGI
jgi:hypothetical protein